MSSSSSSSSAAPAPAAFPPPLLQQQPESLPLPLPPAAAPAEQLCYVHCHFCDTVLVVSVPSSSLFKTVTVRCGHCSSLLTVNMRGLLFPGGAAAAAATAPATAPPQPPPPPAAAAQHGHFHLPHSLNLPANPPHHSLLDELSTASNPGLLLGQQNLATLIASSRSAATPPSATAKGAPKEPPPRTNAVVNRPPEKRQRVPSAYNRFIKDEIQRIKAGNPDISHREAFSAAAKNWAHFPHIHFGLMPDHHSLKKTSLLPQDHQRKDGLLKDGIYAAAAAAAAAAANMGVAPY